MTFTLLVQDDPIFHAHSRAGVVGASSRPPAAKTQTNAAQVNREIELFRINNLSRMDNRNIRNVGEIAWI